MSDPTTQRQTPSLIVEKFGSTGSMPGFSGLQERWHATSSGSHLHFFVNAPGVGPSDGPVLMLAHGYPQTSYTWRYIVPSLQNRIRLFVPDQPGAAHSTPAKSGSKAVLGRAYIEALVSAYGTGVKVVLGGHDRGARISQRLAVSRHELAQEVEVLGVFMIDIVPITAQFQSFGVNPRNAVKYFHWSMLPTPFAVPMIMAYGGERFCHALHERTRGKREDAQKSLYGLHGVDVYAAWYARQDTNEAASEDYRAAAAEDWQEMLEDQKADRKIDIPTKVLHGSGLSSMHNVAEAWKDYVKEGVNLEVIAAEEGYGHNLQEECVDWTLQHIEDFLSALAI